MSSKHSKHGHHIISVAQIVKTAIYLSILMVATIVWAKFALAFPNGWGPFDSRSFSVLNNMIAMTIAVLKGFAVVNIFMGVKYQTDLVKSYAILGFVWMTLMFIMFGDYATRSWEPVVGWERDAQRGLPRASEPYEIGLPPREKIVIPEHGKQGYGETTESGP